jgi:hypothetical protein
VVLERLATLEKTETCDSPDKLLDAVQGAPITKRQLYSADDFSDDDHDEHDAIYMYPDAGDPSDQRTADSELVRTANENFFHQNENSYEFPLVFPFKTIPHMLNVLM